MILLSRELYRDGGLCSAMLCYCIVVLIHFGGTTTTSCLGNIHFLSTRRPVSRGRYYVLAGSYKYLAGAFPPHMIWRELEQIFHVAGNMSRQKSKAISLSRTPKNKQQTTNNAMSMSTTDDDDDGPPTRHQTKQMILWYIMMHSTSM